MTDVRTKPHSWLTALVWLPDIERMRKKHDVTGLIRTLVHPRSKVRGASMRALGELWDIPSLVELGDQDVEIRARAAETLGREADRRAVMPLIASLWDPAVFFADVRFAYPVRVNAIEALGKLGDPRAIEPLVEALRNNSWGYAQKSSEVLYAALAAFGEPMTVRLIELAQDKDEHAHTRLQAMFTLGHIGDPRAIDALADVRRNENDWIIQRAATQALHRIGGEQAVSALIAALQEEGDSRRQREIVSFLSRHEDPRVTHAVLDALQRLGSDA